jgi:hypothetical protein
MSSGALPDDPGTLKAMLLAERMQNERLRQIIKELQRHRFGRRAESLPEDQMLLGLEDVEQSQAGDDAAKPMTPAERSARAERRRSNRGSLPAHLPRVELIVDIDDKTCPCCQRQLHCIGADRSERLDIVPAQFRGAGRVPAQIRLPALRGCGGAGRGAGAVARGRSTHRGDGRPGAGTMPTTFHFTGKHRFVPVRVLIWIARQWPIGSDARPSCCARYTSGCSIG